MFQRLTRTLGLPTWAIHLTLCVAAFLTFELCQQAAFNALSLKRSSAFVFLEFLLFIATFGILYFYGRFNELRAQQSQLLNEASQHEKRDRLRPAKLNVFENLHRLSEGIAESLSAVMFYARTKQSLATDSQESRDLREIMERIDQVQLLTSEMVTLTRDNFLESKSPISAPKRSLSIFGEPSEGYAGRKWPNLMESLRQSPRQVSVLPVSIRFPHDDQELEFQTYTVNVCERGACILFSDESLKEEGIIDIQLPESFQSQARIRWIRAATNNAFKLAGIEFLRVRFPVNN